MFTWGWEIYEVRVGKQHDVVNTLKPRQNGRHFADDIFKCISLNENVWVTIKNSLQFVPKGPINNIPALVQIMAWRRPGDKPLSEPVMVSLLTHICITRPQWVKQPMSVKPWIMLEVSLYLNDASSSFRCVSLLSHGGVKLNCCTECISARKT